MEAKKFSSGCRKTALGVIFIILSFYVYADGWTAAEPYHQTLYADTITSRNDASSVSVADAQGLFVTGDVKTLGNIGIGTLTPAQSLDVVGQIHSTGDICTDAAGGKCLSAVSGEIEAGQVWNSSGANIFNTNSGNVGIGTTSPAQKLTVNGNIGLGASGVISWDGRNLINFDGNNLMIGGSVPAGFIAIRGGGNGILLQNLNGGTTIMQITDDAASARGVIIGHDYVQAYNPPANGMLVEGNVGIGATNPGAKLEVAGQVKITGGAPGAGKVLTSDAEGLATWVAPSSGLGGSGTATQIAFFSAGTSLGSDGNLYWDNNNKRLGIGTASPSTPLHVTGQITSGVSTGTAPLVVASTTKVANLNADLLDGMDSSSFGDATAGNQQTIMGRIGTSSDGAGTSTLFAHASRIYNQVDNSYSAAVSLMGIGSAPSCPGGWTDITGQVSAGSFAPVTSINSVSISPITSMKTVTFCDGGGPNIVVYGCGGGATAVPLGSTSTYNVAGSGSTTTYTLYYRVCALPR